MSEGVGHPERSGFPATTVTEVGKVIDPTTANAEARADAFLRSVHIHSRIS